MKIKDEWAIALVGLLVFAVVLIARGGACTRLERIELKMVSGQRLTGAEYAAYPKLIKRRAECSK